MKNTEFKGTPSPWECAVNTSKETHSIEVKDHDIANDAFIEMYYNSKLIEQSPELLEVLMEAAMYLRSNNVGDATNTILNRANKVINKALGN